MSENPYEPPPIPAQKDSPRRWIRPGKHPVGYLVALLVGTPIIAGLLTEPLAPLDDSGGVQIKVGAFLAVVIYRFLF